MKVSKQSMEKLGFQKFDDAWQHKKYIRLKFNEPVKWEKVIEDVYIEAFNQGGLHKQSEIKQKLGIY